MFLKDEKLQHVLGHFQKDFEGVVSAENLGKSRNYGVMVSWKLIKSLTKIYLSHIDELILVIFQISAGAKFGVYGSFLPTYPRSPVCSHSRTPPKVHYGNASKSPNNMQLEVAFFYGLRHFFIISSSTGSLLIQELLVYLCSQILLLCRMVAIALQFLCLSLSH